MVEPKPQHDWMNAPTSREAAGLIEKGRLTEEGKNLLVRLLTVLPPYKEGEWGEVFLPLMSTVVAANIELVIVRDGEVLLTHRKDKYFVGWHMPGTFISPGETWQQVADRCAHKELGEDVEIEVERPLIPFNHHDSVRFHNVACLLLCKIKRGVPRTGKWFREWPEDIIPEQKKFWPEVQKVLGR